MWTWALRHQRVTNEVPSKVRIVSSRSLTCSIRAETSSLGFSFNLGLVQSHSRMSKRFTQGFQRVPNHESDADLDSNSVFIDHRIRKLRTEFIPHREGMTEDVYGRLKR